MAILYRWQRPDGSFRNVGSGLTWLMITDKAFNIPTFTVSEHKTRATANVMHLWIEYDNKSKDALVPITDFRPEDWPEDVGVFKAIPKGTTFHMWEGRR